MRILCLSCLRKKGNTELYGGAEKSIIGLANWLAQNTNHEVYLYSVEGEGMPFPVDEKVCYKGFNISKKNKWGVHLQMFKNSIKAFDEVKPDIIISFWIHPLYYISKRIKRNKVACIYSERNDPRLEYGIIARKMRQRILNECDGIVFQTSQAREYFEESIKEKSVVIHNPVYIKTNGYEISSGFDNRIVTVGRLSEQKNHRLLIDAFSVIAKEYPDLILEIYGEGGLRSQLESYISSLGLEEKIILCGAQSNVLEKILGARVFVLPSKYEGMPNALMEAMCLGIPVVSSDCPCGGPRELIKTGENGFLFKNNDVDDLCRVLREVLSYEKMNDIQRKERHICESHSQDSIFSKWLNYINHIMKSR